MPRSSSSSPPRGWRRLGQRGAMAVEFALVGSAFLVLIIGTIDVGRYAYTRFSVTAAVGEAKRAAVIDPGLVGCTTPKQRIAVRIPLLNAADLSLCVTRSTTAGVTTVVVDATYPFRFALPLMDQGVISITAHGVATF